jgi:uncharacterized protein (DUF1697 family)
MPVYVSMLRAVNVSARNRIAMADLRELFGRHGHTDVVTYVQSGNVVSRSGARSAGAVERAISTAIADDLGLDVAVLVRTTAQLEQVLGGNRFLAAGGDPKVLHVTFLATAPERSRVAALDEQEHAPDEFHVAGREVFVSCPGGYGRTKINNGWFERKLGVEATTRNWKTVGQLAELARVRS